MAYPSVYNKSAVAGAGRFRGLATAHGTAPRPDPIPTWAWQKAGGERVSKGVVQPIVNTPRFKRNQSCPCKSGKKFKHCCLKTGGR